MTAAPPSGLGSSAAGGVDLRPLAEAAAFAELDDAQLALLESLGDRRAVSAGEYLFRAGDATYDFFAILSGTVEILTQVGGEESVVVRHGARRFLGELNMLTGLRVFLTARVAEAGEVIQVPIATLRELIRTQPALGDIVVSAYMARRGLLQTAASSSIQLVGSRYSPDAMRLREFLARGRIPHEWLDPERDPVACRLLERAGLGDADLPVVLTAGGGVIPHATAGVVSEFLGLTIASIPERCFDLVIAGSGPAGLAAAVYGASEGLRTLGIEMVAPGGQAGTSSRIDNYLGFPTGVSGAHLTQAALVQAERLGARLTVPCTAVSLDERAGHLVVGLSDGVEIGARAVIVATGARYRRLGVDRLADFEAGSVFYAATPVEARECTPEPVMVVGGGNSAGQAALFLAESGSPVTVVIRGADLGASMSQYLIDRIAADPRVEVRPGRTVTELVGDGALESVRLAGADGDETVACRALFSFIGAEPSSAWLSGCAALDEHGFVLTDRALGPEHLDGRWDTLGRAPLPFETSHPGLFAVGDVRSGSTKRVAAAVGEGSAAVRSVHEFLAFAH